MSYINLIRRQVHFTFYLQNEMNYTKVELQLNTLVLELEFRVIILAFDDATCQHKCVMCHFKFTSFFVHPELVKMRYILPILNHN